MTTPFGALARAATILALLSVASAAQREPVLKQIRVPHAYYFREMYLPQLTSGPSGASWSPDGAWLAYSMGGSLWRQRVGSDEAEQLTDGPGYDYQPDWSPDGKRIVYASYRNDAIELRMLDLRAGADRAVVRNGAVNVEPRWSPDGRRMAFVSTVYEGRFHVFVAPVSGDTLGSASRVSPDRDSGLPRYYYGRFDQYLSPTWSPDGRELLLLSNRGHVWGSGGFWRMVAAPGAPLTEVRYEETTWRARPDWGRDGRVVYASYLGRQWHQLWLMTASGGDALQLTYGDFDATSPRWSPDGHRLVFVSNEGGNTSLRVVTVPGGVQSTVRAPRRKYLRPSAELQLTIVDARSGQSIPARVSVISRDGRSWAPDDAWRHADDAFVRRERTFEHAYFHTAGSATLPVPVDSLVVEVTRGLEYLPVRRTLAVSTGRSNVLRIALTRIADLPSLGWFSGDLHVHMNYGGTYRNTPARLMQQARAEDVHLVENLIVNKEGRIPDVSWFTGRTDPVSGNGYLLAHDQEFHTSLWAHTGLLGLTRNLILPGYAAYAGTPAASPAPLNSDVFRMAREQGGVTGYVHPFDFDPDPADTTRALTHAFPVDVALGLVDYYEALGFADDYWATLKVWYRALNCGFRIPAGAGTDAMANFASLRGHIGMDRVFAEVKGTLTHRAFLDALKAGRTFATNGPLVRLTVNGQGPGGEVRVAPGVASRLRVSVWLRSIVPIDHLEIVASGRVVREIPLHGDRTFMDTTVTLPVEGSTWVTLRAWSDGPRHPVLDAFPLGTTSPVYVLVDGQPIRSAADAVYFTAWIDRLRQTVDRSTNWNSAAERDSARRTLEAARAEWERRRE